NSRDISSISALKSQLGISLTSQEKYKEALLRYQDSDNDGFIIKSKEMKRCCALGKQVADIDSGVLIMGDTGVGKTFLAKYIHKQSQRRSEPFITIDCATIPKDLLESEVFGYAKGAFTGANSKGKQGLAELANHGTLFLDEIGEIPCQMQAKMLRLVQDHTFIPIGGVKEVTVDIKLIAATNQNLWELVEKGKFRKDLYYRLDTIKIEIPPLSQRREDITALVDYFLKSFCKKYKKEISFSEQAMEALLHYSWPGNVRELEHIIERLVIINKKPLIDFLDLPKEIILMPQQGKAIGNMPLKKLHILTKEEEKQEIIYKYMVLRSTYKVAEALGISQSKVSRIIKQHRDEQK
ncbi:MAG: sigma 54-interacting transcriptional regulator, partial [Bacillota bacterium]|nr:sigma 54-interacting transcriptional regulator [Bacillota bacterium]